MADSSDLRRKAKWHFDRAGTGVPASMARGAQLSYRAELADRGQDLPAGPLYSKPARPKVEPVVKSDPAPVLRRGRPKPEEFAWR